MTYFWVFALRKHFKHCKPHRLGSAPWGGCRRHGGSGAPWPSMFVNGCLRRKAQALQRSRSVASVPHDAMKIYENMPYSVFLQTGIDIYSLTLGSLFRFWLFDGLAISKAGTTAGTADRSDRSFARRPVRTAKILCICVLYLYKCYWTTCRWTSWSLVTFISLQFTSKLRNRTLLSHTILNLPAVLPRTWLQTELVLTRIAWSMSGYDGRLLPIVSWEFPILYTIYICCHETNCCVAL